MIYTTEEVEKMLKLWAAYREYDDSDDSRLLGCGSPTYAAMMHAKGYVRQSENCRTVFTPPQAPDYYQLIEQATDALWDCPRLQYVVGKLEEDGEVKFYTQARLLMSVVNRRYRYGMSYRRIGKHVGKIIHGESGKRAGDSRIIGLLDEAHGFICDYLNQRIKVCDLAIDETG